MNCVPWAHFLFKQMTDRFRIFAFESIAIRSKEAPHGDSSFLDDQVNSVALKHHAVLFYRVKYF